MNIKRLDYELTVCKVPSTNVLDPDIPFYFVGKTGEEISLVCPTENTPKNTLSREDGWKAFRIEGVLEFSMVGVLSRIAALLAENQISIFAVSTYDTDYILVKEESYERALNVLNGAGYGIV